MLDSMVIMEGKTMIHIPPLTSIQKDQLQHYFGISAVVTLVVSFACYFFLPDEWRWVAYVPAVWLVVAVIITWLAIALHGTGMASLEYVYVNRKRVTCCHFCSMSETKENIVNSKFPVVKCRETAKVCYSPMKIPGWCPYAKK